MSLLDKAKSKPPVMRETMTKLSDEEVELVVAFFNGEITYSQFEFGLGVKTGQYVRSIRLMQRAVKNNQLELVKK